MARKKKSGVYHFFVTLPDLLYPFSATIAGKRVRARLDYEYTLAKFERTYGRGHFGIFITCYRSLFHIAGSIIVITVFAFVARAFFGTERALYVVLGLVTLLITYQEFYYHPRYYHQLFKKGALDWAAWIAPIGIYLTFFKLP